MRKLRAKKLREGNPRLGQWMRDLRKTRKLQQKKVAEQLGIHTDTLRQFESGEQLPWPDGLKRFCTILSLASEERERLFKLYVISGNEPSTDYPSEPFNDKYSPQGTVPSAPADFEAKLWKLDWVAYTPVQRDEYRETFPTKGEITSELKVLRKLDLSGIITFDSRGSLANIPQIAHKAGFDGVIMGIKLPTDEDTIESAIKAAAYVDGYCIGHNQLGHTYQLKTLCDAMEYIRLRTCKSVTTTEYFANYCQLTRWVNWLFPDIGGIWRGGHKTPEILFSRVLEFFHRADELSDRHNKPVLLKMVSFPSGGHQVYTPKVQMDFYERVLTYCRSDIDRPRRVSLSFYSAFNPVWKKSSLGFDESEEHLGICDQYCEPKPAASMFRQIPKIYLQE